MNKIEFSSDFVHYNQQKDVILSHRCQGVSSVLRLYNKGVVPVLVQYLCSTCPVVVQYLLSQ